jgi:hypothetical protein
LSDHIVVIDHFDSSCHFVKIILLSMNRLLLCNNPDDGGADERPHGMVRSSFMAIGIGLSVFAWRDSRKEVA